MTTTQSSDDAARDRPLRWLIAFLAFFLMGLGWGAWQISEKCATMFRDFGLAASGYRTALMLVGTPWTLVATALVAAGALLVARKASGARLGWFVFFLVVLAIALANGLTVFFFLAVRSLSVSVAGDLTVGF